MENLDYMRSEKGRKALISDLTNDLNVAKATFTGNNLTIIKTLIDRFWSGSDATKFYAELVKKAQEAGKECTKYIKFIQTNLDNDAMNFSKMQDSNAGLINTSNGK